MAEAQPCLPLGRGDGRRSREARLLARKDNKVPACREALLAFFSRKTQTEKKGDDASWETNLGAPLTQALRAPESRRASPGGSTRSTRTLSARRTSSRG